MRIAMLGGSFNPIHNGHIAIARAVMAEFSLDEVIFIVAADPPHKEISGGVPAQLRLHMTSLALDGEDNMRASDMEISRGGKSYTADTLEELRLYYPDAALYLIVGEDMARTLPEWRDPKRILSTASLIAVDRPGVAGSLKKACKRLRDEFDADALLSAFTGPELSSTMVRDAVYAAAPIDNMTPAQTADCIYQNALYQPQCIAEMQRRLKANLKPSRYAHSVRTMALALTLASRFGGDPEKTRIAALLHDCAKRAPGSQLALADRCGVDAADIPKNLLHGRLGPIVARDDYGVTDVEILDAIACHTECRERMTTLDKIVYLADKIEPGREYDELARIREMAKTDLDAAVLMCMEDVISYVVKKGETPSEQILAAQRYIINSKK